ncbi:hypothetical protein SAMN02745446_03510 [Desulfococcus multivorans DSM 2059]|nr:hypothetical protein SAMN02745446_03510 [Desulfococcus multivorans DSM 2059]
MWAHLMMCRYCRRFRHQLYFLRSLSRIDEEAVPHSVEEPAAPGLSPEARDRLKKAVQQRVGKGIPTAK